MPSLEPEFPIRKAATELSPEEREALAADIRARIAVCRNLAGSTSRATAEVLREIARNSERELKRLEGRGRG
jgi:hypothetical protein